MSDKCEWKGVPGYEGIYQASIYGAVKYFEEHSRTNEMIGLC